MRLAAKRSADRHQQQQHPHRPPQGRSGGRDCVARGAVQLGQYTFSQPAAAVTHPAATPSPSPAAAPPTAAALASALKAAGLPVGHLIVYTASTDPNHLLGRQGGYRSKVAWADLRAARQDAGDERGSIGLGGGTEVYPTAAGARARYEYLRGFQPPFGDGYDYLDGTAILRLSNYLTPAQALHTRPRSPRRQGRIRKEPADRGRG